MSGKDCCYDNAACDFESRASSWYTIEGAKSSIFEYIEAYSNKKRKHSTIN